jgi:hypothetical protein
LPQVLDVTTFIPNHTGGAGKFEDEQGRSLCGTDMTGRFESKHGGLTNLLSKLAGESPYDSGRQSLRNLKLMGDLDDTPAPTQYLGSGPWAYDFSGHTKQPHPGNGNEFKTLVYVELKGGWDGATGFVNVKDDQEIHLWCEKRGPLTRAYCKCETELAPDDDAKCHKFVLKTAPGESVPASDCSAKIYKMGGTEGLI